MQTICRSEAYRLMTECLLKGGANIEELNAWRKNSDDLFEEIFTNDVTLTPKEVGKRLRAVRTALNVKLMLHSRRGYLCEVARYFKNNGERVKKFKPWALSETRKRGELALDALIRGWIQEGFGPVPPADAFKWNGQPEKIHEHESSVYRNVWSEVHSSHYFLEQDDPVCDDMVIEDGSARIYARWISEEQLRRTGKLVEVMMARADCFPVKESGKLRLVDI